MHATAGKNGLSTHQPQPTQPYSLWPSARGGTLSAREIMRPWTNCISRSLSFLLVKSLEKVLIGHHRSVTLEIIET
jgi:hypothetical protein